MTTLNVCEIFKSIQGETVRAGFPSVFVRLAGCNLRCRYCDTKYAWERGTDMTVDEIVSSVTNLGHFHHITVTGGEPLLQHGTRLLINSFAERGHEVQIETNGSIGVEGLHPACRIILDVKTPSSGEEKSFLPDNLGMLKAGDEIKFVISDEDDYTYCRFFLEKYARSMKPDTTINFSPVLARMPAADLAEMILRDGLAVRLNVQLHAIVWPDGEKRR
jgi:7-carboxy-7-deazaguanine synthase